MEQNEQTGPGDGKRHTAKNTVPDSYLGGADGVDKTSYVADVHGAGVGDHQTRGTPVTAAVSSGRGFGVLGWTAIVLTLLVLAAFAAGLFR